MRAQKHGKTAKDRLDNILLHVCQWLLYSHDLK